MKAGEIFVAGKWQAPLSGETYDADQPRQRGAAGRGRQGRRARHRRRRRGRARKAFDEGPWPQMSAARARPHRVQARRSHRAEPRRDGRGSRASTPARRSSTRGKVEIPFAAEVFRYYAGWATKIHGETLGLRDERLHLHAARAGRRGRRDHAVELPASCSPSWKIAPALAAGSTVVLKPASQTPLTALKLAELAPGGRAAARACSTSSPGPGGKVGMALVRAPARRQDRLHRLDRGRQADHARGGRAR